MAPPMRISLYLERTAALGRRRVGALHRRTFSVTLRFNDRLEHRLSVVMAPLPSRVPAGLRREKTVKKGALVAGDGQKG
jgi:hypothetical protein